MAEVIQVEGRYYILATSDRVDDRTRVLKHGETFAVFDRHGDVQPVGLGEQGLYYADTRFLARLELLLGEDRPVLLSSTVKEDNDLLTADLTNPDILRDGGIATPRGTVHLFRAIFLQERCCYQRVRVTNYGREGVDFTLRFRFESDFADLFEVRGLKRARRGRHSTSVRDGGVELRYEGLDGVPRATRLATVPAAAEVTPCELSFDLRLAPRATETLYLTVTCEVGTKRAQPPAYERAYQSASTQLRRARERIGSVFTSNEQFNDWVNRSAADIQKMVTDTPAGPYPYAGVPWFSTAFGRDGIVTALECLWLQPDLARGVLGFLAGYQAEGVDPERDAEPGKILHETRRGEMAALGEIPFGRYYGAADTTPLFVLLAAAYHDRTGDRAFLERLWPHVERALGWMDRCGDRDGDLLVEYLRQSPGGLANQGWKDSGDSVFHADGRLATGPIALCEIQGYVYAAKRSAAALAAALDHPARAAALWEEANALRRRVEELFWLEDLGTYALALDGEKQACRVRTSNPGHLLFCGLPDSARGRRTAATLLDGDSFSGWGIRTLAEGQARYNPMSYHNGTVWPHDNALIARGLARYDLQDAVLRVLTGLFDASLFVELHRLPELFCGFPRRPGEGPTDYPVACAPQSWAAASVFSLLESCLGLEIDATKREVRFRHPVLPPALEWVRISNLTIPGARVDVRLDRSRDDVGVTITRREGAVDVVVVK